MVVMRDFCSNLNRISCGREGMSGWSCSKIIVALFSAEMVKVTSRSQMPVRWAIHEMVCVLVSLGGMSGWLYSERRSVGRRYGIEEHGGEGT